MTVERSPLFIISFDGFMNTFLRDDGHTFDYGAHDFSLDVDSSKGKLRECISSSSLVSMIYASILQDKAMNGSL